MQTSTTVWFYEQQARLRRQKLLRITAQCWGLPMLDDKPCAGWWDARSGAGNPLATLPFLFAY